MAGVECAECGLDPNLMGMPDDNLDFWKRNERLAALLWKALNIAYILMAVTKSGVNDGCEGGAVMAYASQCACVRKGDWPETK